MYVCMYCSMEKKLPNLYVKNIYSKKKENKQNIEEKTTKFIFFYFLMLFLLFRDH